MCYLLIRHCSLMFGQLYVTGCLVFGNCTLSVEHDDDLIPRLFSFPNFQLLLGNTPSSSLLSEFT